MFATISRSKVFGRLLSAVLAVLLLSGSARAALINVQFGETADGVFGPTPQYTGAAVLGGTTDQWNFVGGAFVADYMNPNATGWGRTVTNQPLFDADGTATSVALSLTTPDAFINLQSFNPFFKNTPHAALMNSFVFADGHRVPPAGNDGPGLITLTGLTPDAVYELILLSAGDVVGRQSVFTVNGDSESVTPTGVAAFIEGNTYARFTVEADALGTLAIAFAAGNGQEANLNGLQLFQVPEPGSFVLMASALALLPLRRRWRQ